jgi:hypothetical protein
MKLTNKLNNFFGTLESKLIWFAFNLFAAPTLIGNAIYNFSEKDYKVAIFEILLGAYSGWMLCKDGKKIVKEYIK